MTQGTVHARPNILLITCHDLGRHLGCYGVPTVHTPHLDRLAASGVRMARAFTTSPGCSPARAALATGRYPHSNGVMGLTHPPFGWDLHPDERHIAQILGDAGYATHLFGFQHVSPRDERPGFDHIHLDQHHGLAGPVASRVAALLAELSDEQPFYIEVNLEEPHRPYDQGGSVPDDLLGVTVPPYLPAGQESVAEMRELQGAIRQADAAIGHILTALDAAQLTADTIVCFVADHGIAMPRAKATLYDPGLEIALLLRWPRGGFVVGAAVDDFISNVDVLPTLLEASGVPLPARIQGRSFLPRLLGKEYTAHSAVFAEKTYHSYYDPMRAVRTDTLKLIRNYEPTFRVEVPGDVAQGAIFRAYTQLYLGGQHPALELYDLGEDPWEQRNLAGEPGYADAQRTLDDRLSGWMVETDDPLLQGFVPSPRFQVIIQ